MNFIFIVCVINNIIVLVFIVFENEFWESFDSYGKDLKKDVFENGWV